MSCSTCKPLGALDTTTVKALAAVMDTVGFKKLVGMMADGLPSAPRDATGKPDVGLLVAREMKRLREVCAGDYDFIQAFIAVLAARGVDVKVNVNYPKPETARKARKSA